MITKSEHVLFKYLRNRTGDRLNDMLPLDPVRIFNELIDTNLPEGEIAWLMVFNSHYIRELKCLSYNRERNDSLSNIMLSVYHQYLNGDFTITKNDICACELVYHKIGDYVKTGDYYPIGHILYSCIARQSISPLLSALKEHTVSISFLHQYVIYSMMDTANQTIEKDLHKHLDVKTTLLVWLTCNYHISNDELCELINILSEESKYV